MSDNQRKRKAKWQNDYIARAYDRINLTVPKGRKATIEDAARQRGESVNGYINSLLQTDLCMTANDWKLLKGDQ